MYVVLDAGSIIANNFINKEAVMWHQQLTLSEAPAGCSVTLIADDCLSCSDFWWDVIPEPSNCHMRRWNAWRLRKLSKWLVSRIRPRWQTSKLLSGLWWHKQSLHVNEGSPSSQYTNLAVIQKLSTQAHLSNAGAVSTLLLWYNALFRVQVALQHCKWNRDVWYFWYTIFSILSPVFLVPKLHIR